MWVSMGYNPQELLEKAINTMPNCHLKRGGLETWQKIVVVRRCCGELLGGYGRNKGGVFLFLHVQPSIKGNRWSKIWGSYISKGHFSKWMTITHDHIQLKSILPPRQDVMIPVVSAQGKVFSFKDGDFSMVSFTRWAQKTSCKWSYGSLKNGRE